MTNYIPLCKYPKLINGKRVELLDYNSLKDDSTKKAYLVSYNKQLQWYEELYTVSSEISDDIRQQIKTVPYIIIDNHVLHIRDFQDVGMAHF